MKETLWRFAAYIVSRRPVAQYLISRAQRTPYSPILGRTDDRLYMDRWWLFNPYLKDAAGQQVTSRVSSNIKTKRKVAALFKAVE